MDGVVVEVFQGQVVYVVVSGGGVQYIGFEYGVVGYVLQCDGGVGIGQDIDVVFGMLVDFEFFWIFQQWF